MSDNGFDNTVKRGPVKVGYLVTGLVFLGLAGSWALRESGAVGDVTVGWLLPAILVGAGAIGLVAMLASGVRRGPPDVVTATETGQETYDTNDSAGSDDDTRTLPEEDPR